MMPSNTQGDNMEPLSPGASLPHIQAYVRDMEIERGLNRQELTSQCLKLGEEVGELYRAVRKLQGEPQDPSGRIADVGDEAVDTLILLMSIVNRCGVNLEEAFRAKEARNETRVWV
jgi:NTP pyrophosphatase (non-canonical NTP hydrolase)